MKSRRRNRLSRKTKTVSKCLIYDKTERKEEIIRNLKLLMKYLFRPENLIVSCTAEKKSLELDILLPAARYYGNEEMLSVYYEVKRKGIQGMKERVQRIRMSDMPSFSGELGRNRMMFISDVDTQVQDELVKAMFSLCGCECLAVRRLNDGRHDWVGSLFCEYTEMTDMDRSLVECVMDEAAMNIQYILPDYR